jgi:hypothetical protein
MLAFGDIIVKVLKSQATQNLRWHQESQMVLLENIQATSIAVAATGTMRGPLDGLKTQDLACVLWV